jgi:hypothetical protein
VSDSDALVPAHGARFVLELSSASDGVAVYAAAVITPSARHDYRAELSESGDVSLTAVSDPASRDHEGMLAMIARLVARGAAGRRTDGLQPWPARITRWRGPGRGG